MYDKLIPDNSSQVDPDNLMQKSEKKRFPPDIEVFLVIVSFTLRY